MLVCLVKTLARLLTCIHVTAFGFSTMHKPSHPWPLYLKTDLFQRKNRGKNSWRTLLSSSYNAVCIFASCEMCSFIRKCLNTALLSTACVLWSLSGGEVIVKYNSYRITGAVTYMLMQSHWSQMFRTSHRWKL